MGHRPALRSTGAGHPHRAAFTRSALVGASSTGMLMEHVQIAVDLLVILIGFAALATAVSWALRTGESHLRNFCVVYALFTLVLIITVLKKYLFVNFQGYSAWSWYVISGCLQVVNFAVVV